MISAISSHTKLHAIMWAMFFVNKPFSFCYVCSKETLKAKRTCKKILEFSSINKYKIEYLNIPSAITHIPHDASSMYVRKHQEKYEIASESDEVLR